MKRTTFCSVAFLVVALFPGTASLAQDAKTRFKIDSHYHYRDEPDFIKKTVETYRKYNTMVCVLTPIKALEVVKGAVKTYPDVIIGYGSISLDDPGALDQIDKFHAAGFRGIGELSNPLKDYNDPAYFPIYQRMERYGMHVLFHTGVVARRNPEKPGTTGMAKMRPAFLDEVARRFPKITLQGAHLGNPWYDEAAEAARWNPNLYFDITGSSLIKKKDTPQFWAEILWWRPSLESMHSPSAGDHAFDKIIFGTDENPEGLLPNIERFDAFLKANKIPEDVQAKCWAGTIARILGIDLKARPARPGMARKIEESEREEKTGNLLLVPRKMSEAIELGLVRLKKGEKNRLAVHPDEEEGYLILKGKGLLLLGEAKQPVAAGMVAYIPRNTQHQIECTSDEPLEYVYFASWR